MTPIRFFVAGIPKSMSVGSTVRWKTKDGSRQGQFQTRANTDWGLVVAEVGRRHAPPAPFAGPVSFKALFLVPKPSTAGRHVVAPLKRPDIDNLVHKLTDHFNGIFWLDDSQIVDFAAFKRFAGPGSQTGVEITVEQIMPSQAELSWRAEEIARL